MLYPLLLSLTHTQPLTAQHHHILLILQPRLVQVSIGTSPSILHQLYCRGCTRCKKLTLESQQVHLRLPWLWSGQHLDTPAASLVELLPSGDSLSVTPKSKKDGPSLTQPWFFLLCSKDLFLGFMSTHSSSFVPYCHSFSICPSLISSAQQQYLLAT